MQISLSSVLEILMHTPTSTNLSATAAVFCELGFFINGGDATINPHFDLCSKEINLVGSWVYNLRDYATTFDFLKRAKAIGLPMSELITDKYPLEEINEALEKNLSMTGLKIAVVNK